MYKIIIENTEKGIAITANERNQLASAYVNGKHYDLTGFRPLSGDGRQLKEDNRDAIRELLPKARDALQKLIDAETARDMEIKNRAMEVARKESVTAHKTFADALQDAFLQTLTEKSAGEMVEQIYPTVEKMVVDKFGLVPVVHEIKIPERPKAEVKGILHKDFDEIINILTDTLDGREGVYMYGPAGTGKGYLAKQIATALGVEYYYANCITDEVQLKGFIDANGRYHETEFYKAFTRGGVFLLDELDGSVPETLLALNEALANGYYPFPMGKATAHPDFYCLSAGNTFGTGADAEYTGRYQLDASSLDRFAVIKIDYDSRIENAMSGGDADLVNFAHDFRKAVKTAGINCLFTYRGIKRLHKFSAYMTKEKAIRIGLTKGMPGDDMQIIYNKLTDTANPWAKAFNALIKEV